MHPRLKRGILTSVAILTIAALAVFLVPTALAVDAFPDVPDSHFAHDFIKWLFDNGITSGFPDGTYRPDNNVTRAQMAVFIQQVAGAGSAGPVTDADKLDGLDSSAFLLDFYTSASNFTTGGGAGGGGGAVVTCDAGDQATGGGFSIPFGQGLLVTESKPSGNNGWFVEVERTVAGTFTIDTFVRCAT